MGGKELFLTTKYAFSFPLICAWAKKGVNILYHMRLDWLLSSGKAGQIMFKRKSPELYYVNERTVTATEELASLLTRCTDQAGGPSSEIVFLCIGSDRITGDSLGPLTGYFLAPYRDRTFHVYGTLDDPVHALNLKDRITYISRKHPDALLIAIDASLGSRRHQGYITIGNGTLKPGAGAGKNLPEVGDIFITGIVNVSGSFEQLLLQTTRLSCIYHMAEAISRGILLARSELETAGTVISANSQDRAIRSQSF